jgi:type II secretory pathway pseudopilin PulG
MNNLLPKYSGRNNFAQRHFFNKKSTTGFTLIELFVVIVIIIILSIIGLRSYSAFTVKQRDAERLFQLHRFAKLLEQYRNDRGAYPCGTGSAGYCAYDVVHNGYIGSVDQLYEVSCSDYVSNGNSLGNDTSEVATFLNGGQCCVDKDSYSDPSIGKYVSSFPDPTSTPTSACPSISVEADSGRLCDDSAWGLYRWGYYSDTSNIKDPLNNLVNGKQYYYCYAVTGAGRKEYALYVRMENTAANKTDQGGIRDTWYEIYSPGFNKDVNDGKAHGWSPWQMDATWQ